MQGSGSSSDEQKAISAWVALQPRRAPHPPNPLRYSHTFWFALGVFALAIALTISIFPARAVESDMLADARQAKIDGFPSLPPGDPTNQQLNDWIGEWYTGDIPFPGRGPVLELAARVGEYETDSSLINLGVTGSLAALVFLAGLGFGRALNNLYALGYGASVLSPAWAFISWIVPLLSFVLPWRVVTEVVQCAWQKPEDAATGGTSRWPQYLAGLWGVAFAALWLLNPISVNIFFRGGDIDAWIGHIQWTERMLIWLPVPAFFTAVMLMAVAIKQHGRYRELDRIATAARPQP